MMTSVIPQANMANTDMWRSISRWVFHLKKAPSALKIIPIKNTSTSAAKALSKGDRIQLLF
jgi:hypothetical protein